MGTNDGWIDAYLTVCGFDCYLIVGKTKTGDPDRLMVMVCDGCDGVWSGR